MNKIIIGMVKDGAEVVRVEHNYELTNRFRTADRMETATFETVWQLIKRQAEESSIQKERWWFEVAQALGYPNMESIHSDGLSVEIHHAEGAIVCFKKIEKVSK